MGGIRGRGRKENEGWTSLEDIIFGKRFLPRRGGWYRLSGQSGKASDTEKKLSGGAAVE